MMKLPKAKMTNIVEQIAGDEVLIYDLTTNNAYSLNKTSVSVYKACDGITTFDELKRAQNFSDDVIYLALDELKRNNLLTDENYKSPFAGINRREVIKKVASASMIALPVVVGLTAPKAAHAASVCQPGSPNSFGERNGQPVGQTLTRINPNGTETCNDYSASDRDNLCNIVYRSQCCSDNAVSTNCQNVSPGRTTYSCVCSA